MAWAFSPYFSSLSIGALVTGLTLNLGLGSLATAGLNQATNGIYFNYFANPNSSIDDVSCRGRYLTRWERLDYVKTKFGQDSKYNLNALRVYGEYFGHMYFYYAVP